MSARIITVWRIAPEGLLRSLDVVESDEVFNVQACFPDLCILSDISGPLFSIADAGLRNFSFKMIHRVGTKSFPRDGPRGHFFVQPLKIQVTATLS